MATSEQPVLIYVQRPGGESLWLPESILAVIGARHGDRLSSEQRGSRAVQELIAARLKPQKGGSGDGK
jgi:hypothetical protein